MVAFRMRRYKAPTDFVFFGRDKNDNNNEILAITSDSRPNYRRGLRKDVPSMIPRVFPRASARSRRRGQPQAAHVPEDWLQEQRPSSYWVATRRPFPSLLFVAPLAIAYECAVFWRSGPSGAGGSRTGADAWMCHALDSVGLSHPWFLPLLLAVILLGWQVVSSHKWRFSPSILGGMIVESVTWAIALLGMGRLIDLGFSYLEQGRLPLLAADPAAANHPDVTALIGYIGAGVYEETLFRLMLIPVFFGILRLLQMPQVLSSSWAVTASALLFALAHHAGSPGEAFTWYAFIFRWMAGIFFAWVFVLRGFGIAVGTHTAYDILVGWIG
jgi:Type II CAAX prenyl endopeptidase Rce1-like